MHRKLLPLYRLAEDAIQGIPGVSLAKYAVAFAVFVPDDITELFLDSCGHGMHNITESLVRFELNYDDGGILSLTRQAVSRGDSLNMEQGGRNEVSEDKEYVTLEFAMEYIAESMHDDIIKLLDVSRKLRELRSNTRLSTINWIGPDDYDD